MSQGNMDRLVVNVDANDPNKSVNLAGKLVEVITSGRIKEFEIQPIEDDGIFLIVEQERYLLINKKHLKGLYMHWRTVFLATKNRNDAENSSLKTAALILLVVNPNFASAWSYQKFLISQRLETTKETQSNLDTIVDELDFVRLILSKHFKCEQAYIHRRWLVKRLFTFVESSKRSDYTLRFFQSESELVLKKLAPKIKSNYYCWTYLNWLLTSFDLPGIDCRLEIYADLLQQFQDLAYLMPSDNCLFHSRLNLISIIYHKYGDMTYFYETLIPNEIIFLDDLLVRYPFYLTVWNYRKYFMLLVKVHAKSDRFPLTFDMNKTNKSLSDALESQVGSNSFEGFEYLPKGELSFRTLFERDIQLAKFVSSTFECREHERSADIEAYSSKFQQFFQKFID